MGSPCTSVGHTLQSASLPPEWRVTTGNRTEWKEVQIHVAGEDSLDQLACSNELNDVFRVRHVFLVLNPPPCRVTVTVAVTSHVSDCSAPKPTIDRVRNAKRRHEISILFPRVPHQVESEPRAESLGCGVDVHLPQVSGIQ